MGWTLIKITVCPREESGFLPVAQQINSKTNFNNFRGILFFKQFEDKQI